MACRQTGRGLVLGVSLLALLGSACTTDPPPPPPPASTTASPTETAQEREERLAYEAAEKSYREFREEFNRVLKEGGATKPTAAMSRLAGGPYLRELQAGSEAYHGLKHRAAGSEVIVYVRPVGYSPTELVMQICEDSRGVSTFNSKGKKLYSGDLRELNLVFRLRDRTWKAWTGSGKKVQSCA